MYNFQSVRKDLIDISDQTYKISSDLMDDSTRVSIDRYGLLDPVDLLKKGDSFIPLKGHNKLLYLGAKSTLPEQIDARVFIEIDDAYFYNRLALKITRGEVGPVGRVRALMIFSGIFSIDSEKLKEIASELLAIPDYIYESPYDLLNLPPGMLKYIDSKKVPFKIIRDILKLSDAARAALSLFLERRSVKINIFKKLIDLLFDLSGVESEDRFLEILNDIELNDVETYAEIFELRYPHYSLQKKEANRLIGEISTGGVTVDFPEFFERDRFFLKIPVTSRDGEADLKKRMEKIDAELILQLKEML